MCEEIGVNVGAFVYFPGLGMESWCAYDTCEWRWVENGCMYNGERGRDGDNSRIQKFNKGREGQGKDQDYER
jgi:phage-related protein